MTDKRTDFLEYSRHFANMGNLTPSQDIQAWQIERDFAKPWMSSLARSARILDVGCGWGHQLYILKELGFENLVGIEISTSSYEVAKQELAKDAEILNVDAFDYLNSSHDEFDAIVLNDVLEHFPREKILEFLALVNAALRPGGVVSVRVPNMSSLLATFSRDLDFTHTVGFTEFSLEQVLDMTGFAECRLVSLRPKLFFSLSHPGRAFLRLGRVGLYFLNRWLHMGLYCLRSQRLYPREFEYNFEMTARKPGQDHGN